MRIYLFLVIMLFQYINTAFAHGLASNMVAPVGYFVNHVEQLDKIKQNLVKFRKTSLVGISGIGKTQLVRMYAYENRENYDLIWFFDCNLDLNDQLLKLAQAINKKDTTAHISEDLKVLKKQVFDYLTDKEGWLLVLDNLKIGENNKAHEFVTWENNGHIILCSQESNGITNIINLIRLSEDSIKVLSKNLLEDENEHSLDFLIKELDGYPVLIVQGVQLLNNIKGLDREEYKKMTFKESDKIITNIKLAWKELSSDARELASIIAIINNQEFSKNFLKSVVPLELDLSDAIYQLTKLGLIQNINTSTEGAIFEMHDIIAVNITQLNQSNNKQYIEDILLRIVSSMPKDIIKGFAYRRQEIVQKNIEVIQRNAEKFKADLQNVMSLKLNLFSDYTNNYDFYKSAQMVNWFYNQDQDLLFKAMNKNDESIKIYANYLCLIGAYYRNKYMDYRKGLDLHLEAISLLEGIEERKDVLSRCYGYYNIASQFSYLGQEESALEYINLVETMLKNGDISEQYQFLHNVVKSHLFAIKGDSKKALKEINLALEELFAINVNSRSILFTQIYLTRSNILSDLKQYAEASKQIEILYQIHKLLPYGENSSVMGRIYLQKARAAFGLEQKIKSTEYVNKAIEIFTLEDNIELPNANTSINPELAEAYTLKGNLEVSSGNLVSALDYYRRAQVIYFYLYNKNIKNIAKVSELYLRGAKAACENKDLYFYKGFGEPQIEEFGLEHPNTIQMLKHCEKHGMDLWVEGS